MGSCDYCHKVKLMKNSGFCCFFIVSAGEIAFRIRGFTPIPLFLICLYFCKFDLELFLVGLSCVAVGELLRFYSAGFLGPSLRSTEGARADKLIIAGPYRIIRNPIYVGNMSIYLGFAVLSNVFFPLFPSLILLFFIIIYGAISKYEEAFLRVTFPASYGAFHNSVPAFIPSLKVYPAKSTHVFSAFRAWTTEKSTFMTLALSLGGLSLKMLYF